MRASIPPNLKRSAPSLRTRIFVGLALAIVLALAGQIAFGYTSFRRLIESEIAGYLSRFGDSLETRLDFNSKPPSLKTPLTNKRFHFQVLEGSRIVLRSEDFALDQADWVYASKPFSAASGKSLLLRYAFDAAENRLAVAEYLRINLLGFPITLLLALLVSWALVRVLTRPLEALNRAAQDVSQSRMPEPVRIPPGDDELARLATSFNRMTETIRSLLERERAFTRYASHELRTPLSTFRAQVEALELDLLPRQAVIQSLKEAMVRMENVLSGLMNLTRAVQTELEPVNLEMVIREILVSIPDEDRARIKLETHGPVMAFAQCKLIDQAARNLLENALKYSNGSVSVRLEMLESNASLIVRDFGPGVPHEALSRLTEPFYRLEDRSGGLGLGLALVQRIVEALGGTLELRNTHPGLEVRLALLRIHGSRIEPSLETAV